MALQRVHKKLTHTLESSEGVPPAGAAPAALVELRVLAASAEAASRGVLAREVDLATDAAWRTGRACGDVADAVSGANKLHTALSVLVETTAAARLVAANLVMSRSND